MCFVIYTNRNEVCAVIRVYRQVPENDLNMHKKTSLEQHKESLMLATNLLQFGDIYSVFHENNCV
jgi:hypothetical protein